MKSSNFDKHTLTCSLGCWNTNIMKVCADTGSQTHVCRTNSVMCTTRPPTHSPTLTERQRRDVLLFDALLRLHFCLCVMSVTNCLSPVQNHTVSPLLMLRTLVFPSVFLKISFLYSLTHFSLVHFLFCSCCCSILLTCSFCFSPPFTLFSHFLTSVL